MSLVSLLFFELLVDLRCSRLVPTSARTSPQPRLRSFFRGRRALPRRLAANDQNAIEILKGISPVAWRNVNLIGNFDFTTGTSPVDIEALV